MSHKPESDTIQCSVRTQTRVRGIKWSVETQTKVEGLRPKRSSVRFEFDQMFSNIFHNYGHGGAGFTVAWGCAMELAEVLKENK